MPDTSNRAIGAGAVLIVLAEDFMIQNEVFTLAASQQYLAIGTIHKGLLLLDRADFSAQYYNENNGLQNNTVLSLPAHGRVFSGHHASLVGSAQET